MKIQILADLHLEHEGGATPYSLAMNPAWYEMMLVEPDVVVLAGDTHTKGRGPALVRDLWPNQQIVMVGGNHEYYGQTYPHHLFDLEVKSQKFERLHFLENRVVEIEDVVFLGCALWTDGRLFEAGPKAGLYPYPVAMMDMQAGMNDYRQIRFQDGSRNRPLKAADMIMEHRMSVRWLREQFEVYNGRKIVVVTHHAPSWRSIPPEYQEDAVSAAYASHLDELVESSGALLWIHGHTHSQVDYMIGQTRVIGNAKGYPFEKTGFRPDLVVEV